MQNPYFGRLLTAMVTPFYEDGVNLAAAGELAEWLLAHGSDGLVVEGSTGEAAALTKEEKVAILKEVVNKVRGRAKIVVGAGSNITADTIDLIKTLEPCKPDGFLIVGPYYNKPTQEGFYQHFAAVAQSTKLPIIIYNVPGRTGSNILPATVARLAKDFQNIVAIKEAAGNVAQVAELYQLLPHDFTIYCGDDGLILPLMSVGATGLISVLGNINGKILQDLMLAYEKGKVDDARELNAQMQPLAKALFWESNPIPVKYAVTKVTGIDVGKPRLPLTPLSKEFCKKMDDILREYKMI